MSTIAPSGWSCAQRRVGRAGRAEVQQQQQQQRTDGQMVRRHLVGLEGVVSTITPSGWGCAQRRVVRSRAGPGVRAEVQQLQQRTDGDGACDVQSPDRVPVSGGAGVEGRFHLEEDWLPPAADWRKILTE